MACLEIECMKCDFSEFNNTGRPAKCPKCGNENKEDWRVTFDEDPERD